jgi:hypothetical protein
LTVTFEEGILRRGRDDSPAASARIENDFGLEWKGGSGGREYVRNAKDRDGYIHSNNNR